MSAITAARAWLRRLAAAAPSAWHFDPVFRWSTIGAGVSLALFILQLTESVAPRGSSPVPVTSVPASLGPSYGQTGGSPVAPPTGASDSPTSMIPKISPGRSLDDVTIGPAPDHDRFGSVPPATHR
jgi:hypothetical protein